MWCGHSLSAIMSCGRMQGLVRLKSVRVKPQVTQLRGFTDTCAKRRMADIQHTATAAMHAIRVQRHVTTHIPRKDSTHLLNALLEAQHWGEIQMLFQSYESARELETLDAQHPERFVTSAGRSLAVETQRRADVRYFSSAISVDILTQVLTAFLQRIGQDDVVFKEPTAFEDVSMFLSFLPNELLFTPELLRIILLPLWNSNSPSSMEEMHVVMKALCANKMVFQDETLIKSKVSKALLHSIAFRQKNRKSTIPVKVLQQNSRESFAMLQTEKVIACLYLESPGLEKAICESPNDEKVGHLLAVLHFLSAYPAEKWKQACAFVERIQKNVHHDEDRLRPFWKACVLSIARLAALNDDFDAAVDLCNSQHIEPSDPILSHLYYTFVIITARMPFLREGHMLQKHRAGNSVQFHIVLDTKGEAFTLNDFFRLGRELKVSPPPHFLQTLLGKWATRDSQKAQRLCFEVFDVADDLLSQDDFCTIIRVLCQNHARSELHRIIYSMRNSSEMKNAQQSEKDHIAHWKLFSSHWQNIQNNILLSSESATLIMHSMLKANFVDLAFDVFWIHCAAHFRFFQESEIDQPKQVYPKIPKDIHFYAVSLAVCLKAAMDLLMRKLLHAFYTVAIPHVLSQNASKSLSHSDQSALAEFFGGHISTESTPMGCAESLFTMLKSYLSTGELVKMRHFLETIALPENIAPIELGGVALSPAKLYELCVGRFPRSLLE